MPVRASDRVTLSVLPAPSYVRLFYLLQESALAAPAKPTVNPPAAPWTTTEPGYTAGSTKTLYTVMLTAYGSVAFEFGDVQKSSAYEAAKQAYNLAAAKANVPVRSTSVASGPGKNGDLWEQWSSLAAGGKLLKFWRHNGTSWILGAIDPTYLPAVSIGEGTFGQLTGGRIDMASFWADEGNIGVLEAGIISADWLQPNVGDVLNLTGNAVTILLNDRQDAQGIAITQAAETAGEAADLAAAAALAASQAQDAVSALAVGRVLTAEQTIAALSGKLDAYDNSFSFESDGLHIRESATAQAEMLLTSAGARLIANGVTVSEWNQGQFIVSQIVAAGGRLGNHLIDSSRPGHTTFRQA